MNSITVPAAAGAAAATRMVWLPGAYHAARDFLDAGFASAVQQRSLALDLTFVDLEMQHLGDRSILQRLHADIIGPALGAGVTVWLGGISLGAFFALDYAQSHHGERVGLCLLAPYLGNRMLTAEVAQAGLAAWQPGRLAETDEERRVWRYLKTRRADLAPLYLGFGNDDRFAAAHGLLAATLPPAAVNAIAGGHDWVTWTALWENFLDSRFMNLAL